MGNKQNKYGNILIRTDQPYYISGDMVCGNVYLNCFQSFKSSKIVLIIEGREESWWKVEESDKNQKKNNSQKSFKHYQGENLLYSHYINLYDIPECNLLKGQYIFPFAFKLNTFLPGTFYEEKSNYKGRIFYKLRTQCYSLKKDIELKNEQELVIRQPQKQFQRSMYGEITFQPKTCCCCNQGRSKIKCYFDKNCYLPGDEAVIICEVDNLNCDLKIQRIDCTLVKTLLLISNEGAEKTIKQTITQIRFPGLEAGRAYLGQNAQRMSLKLTNKKEDKPIQPSTDGRFIKCQYELEIRAIMKGCICCSHVPSVVAQIKILSAPAVLAAVQQPQDWTPQIKQRKQLVISQKNFGSNPYILAMNESSTTNSIS